MAMVVTVMIMPAGTARAKQEDRANLFRHWIG